MWMNPKYKYHIKINVPTTEEEYINGNGEGMWALADDVCKRAYDEDDEFGEFIVLLDNDSIYWEGLEHGVEVPIEMRGDKRPVVSYNYLAGMFGY